ncbi:MAG: HAMP domain-containing sensor histidine kinase [Myxococcota bacterium]
MGLRAKLTLTLAVLVIPMSVALVAVQNHWARETAAEAMAEGLITRVSRGGLERCERAPALWPRRARRGRHHRRHRRRGPGEIFVYDTGLHAAREGSPDLGRLNEPLQADGFGWYVEEGILHVAVRVNDDGPCAVMMVRRPVDRLSTPRWPAVVVAALAVLIAALAAGPLVRRIRRLTAAVRASQEEELRSLVGNDEIGALAEAFSEDRRRLQEQMAALRQRDETLTAFVANTTHDVMIPLTVLQGHLVKLRDWLTEGAERSTVELALEEADYLGALMRNLGVAARLEAGDRPLEKTEVDVASLVERVVLRHRPVAEQRSVSIDFAVPDAAAIHADLTLVEQLVSNLVHNAVRYNDAGGHVAVILEMEGERFRLQVLDDGPGVAPEDLQRLGERRFRGGDARSRTVGSGLGLSIASDVAHQHGFRLRFEANEPKGLRVVLEGARA